MCELHNHGHGHGSANASATLTVAATTMDQQVQLEGPIYKQLYAEQSNKHLRYACIQWYVIAAILLALAVLRVARVSRQTARLARRIERFWCKTSLCGQDLHTTRAQFATLLVYVLYNLVFTFVDVPYGHSYHYVSSHAKGYVQKATTLQFIANRTGFLAFAGIPLIFLLVARLGVVRVLTGVSYHHLNLAHKWVGWTVLVLSWLHATLWTIEMGLHYQMEGGYLATRWRKIYWIAGCFATVFLSYMTIHSFAAIRRNTGYEFFRITHNLGSILFLIGCWVHWTETFQWIAAALAIYFADRLARYCTLGLHYFRAGRKSSLSGQVFTDEDGVSVAKITIQDSGLGAWYPGQHIYMTCISRAEWQPHPFTVANCGKGTEDLHLIIRRKSGMTQDLVDYLSCEKASVRVLLEGPHGGIERAQLLESHILLIVGGTGISFALSVLDFISKTTRTSQHKIKLVWYIRRNENVRWAREELANFGIQIGDSLSVMCVVTREKASEIAGLTSCAIAASEKGFSVPCVCPVHKEGVSMQQRGPTNTVQSVIDETFKHIPTTEPAVVLVCGPEELACEARKYTEKLGRAQVSCHLESYEI